MLETVRDRGRRADATRPSTRAENRRGCRSLAVALLALAAMAAGPALAQDKAGADRQKAGRTDWTQPVATIERDEIERSGAQSLADLLTTALAYNSFGLLRARSLGQDGAVFYVNGRRIPDPSADGGLDESYALEFVPLAAIERIEILDTGAAGLNALGARGGAYNIVLRRDYTGTTVRADTTRPVRRGGETDTIAGLWGGKVGRSHLVIGFEGFQRSEIPSASRKYSRASWTADGAFADTVGVSLSGNTLFIPVGDGAVARPLGSCEGKGYAGPLKDPGGVPGTACGYAYADVAWASTRIQRQGLFASLDHTLNGAATLYADARFAQGDTALRFAPAVDTFSISSDVLTNAQRQALIDSGITTIPATLQLAHRFVGHGTRDWKWDVQEIDLTLGLRGRLPAESGYDASVRFYRYRGDDDASTFVSWNLLQPLIASGAYNLANPSSTDDTHLAAIRATGLRMYRDTLVEHRTARVAFDGAGFSLPGGAARWRAGIGADHSRQYDAREYRDVAGGTHTGEEVLGSGGATFSGKRQTWSGFAGLELPVRRDWTVGLSLRGDSHDDVGTTHSYRVATAWQAHRMLTLRGSWEAGTTPPSLRKLHSSVLFTYPYICDTKNHTGPGACGRTQFRMASGGNPNLKPERSQIYSVGAQAALGFLSVGADWFRAQSANLAIRSNAQELVDLEAAGQPLPPGASVVRVGGAIERIINPLVNTGESTSSGFDIRARARWKIDPVNAGADLNWFYIAENRLKNRGKPQATGFPRHRVQGALRAGWKGLTASWSTRFISGYTLPQAGIRFKAWMGHDLTVDWRDAFGLMGTTLRGGVLNVADRGPSVATTNPNIADARFDSARGRTIFVSLAAKW